MQFKRFAVYQCSSCTRQIEIQQDPTSPGPTRCNITYKCPGTLSLVTTRSVRTELFPPVVFGLQDYIQRGTTLATVTPAAVVIDANLMNSGGNGSLSIAAIRKDVSGRTNHFYTMNTAGARVYTETTVFNPAQLPVITQFTLNLYQLTSGILSYNRYLYNRGSNTQFVQGADDSAQSVNLRFTSANKVRVFINGIELASTAFDVSVPNQVTFTPLLTGTSNVIEIFVYQDITTAISNASLIPLTFSQLNTGNTTSLALRDVNAWGDSGSVTIEGVERFILYCTNIGALGASGSYGIASAYTTSETGVVAQIDPRELVLLIGYAPYGFSDKDLNHYVRVNDLITGSGVLTLGQGAQTGQLELTCPQDYVTSVFNQIVVGVKVAAAVTQETSGTSLVVTPLSNNFILGPS